MGRQRRSFSDEYKREAVRRLPDGKQGLSQIARDLGVDAGRKLTHFAGIHQNLLDAWRRKLGKSATVSRASISASSLEEENARLRRENAALKEDREILKKAAAAFFAKESR